jgi:ferredoxin-NADP reductase
MRKARAWCAWCWPIRTGRPLPAWSAGSHVDLVAGGFRRKYSLCGTRDDRSVLEVVILREAQGRGGSRHFCDAVAAGDTIHLAGPKNLFRLDESAQHVLLDRRRHRHHAAWLAMADRLKALGRPYHLHYAGRSRPRMALLSRLLQDHGDHLSFTSRPRASGCTWRRRWSVSTPTHASSPADRTG